MVFQFLPSSSSWDCVVSYGGDVTRSCFGQIVCPLVSFGSCMSFNPVKGDRGGGSQFVFNLETTAKGCVVFLFAMASSAALESTFIA